MEANRNLSTIDRLKTAFSHFNNGRFSQSISLCELILKEEAENTDALNLLASSYFKTDKLDKAIMAQEKALSIKPESIDVLKNLELFYRKNSQYEDAVETIKKAISIDPNVENFYYCAGISYCQLWKIEEAKGMLTKALDINQQYLNAHIMLGNVLQELREYEKAAEHFEIALKLDPYNNQVIYNRSMLQLLLGDYKNGFKNYETRWLQNEKLGLPDFVRNKTKWDGFAFGNSTLLIMMEQGHGDAIQFSRYIPKATKMGENIIVRCTSNLIELLKPLAPQATWISYDDALPEFDYYITLMSCPLVFGTEVETIPNEMPYLEVDNKQSEKFSNLVNNNKIKVGVCWAGSDKHAKDHVRSIDPILFAKLFDENPQISFYGLVKGRDQAISQELSEKENFTDLANDIESFYDTAGVIENLDLVISVDTALVHLSGAMNKKTWTLAQYNPDWRWLKDGEDSPWYPNMRVFRQKTMGDWETVLKNISENLKNYDGK